MTNRKAPPSDAHATGLDTEFTRGLGLYDSTMVVIGSMIGSGIFIVSADMAKILGSPGWLLVAWILTGALTVAGALVYGELAGMFPHAGGQYIFLREAYSPLGGFLYGWALFLVIQTGTIAAVAVAFARFLGVIVPWFSESNYLISPIHLTADHAISLSTAQATAIALILVLTVSNILGLQYGKRIQNVFTVTKTGALIGLILVGLTLGYRSDVVASVFESFWNRQPAAPIVDGLSSVTLWGLIAALGVSQTGSLFSADSWHVISFAAEEVENPRRNLPLAMAFGTIVVTGLYLLANVAYLVAIPLGDIQNVPNGRVGTALMDSIFPGPGTMLMSAAIMISTFGCNNGLILSGARAYYAMAKDGLFFASAGRLNSAGTPAWGLWLQAAWSVFLVLPRTFDSKTGQYGNLYSDLLDYVVSAALLFYIATIFGLIRLRQTRPNADRPIRAWGYPWLPFAYIIGATSIIVVLVLYRPMTTWPGLGLVAMGIPVYYFFRIGKR